MDVMTLAIVFPLVTAIASAILLWFSNQTEESSWQKLFIGLGVLLLATTFLQTGTFDLGGYSEECNVTKNYMNVTVPSQEIVKIDQTNSSTTDITGYTYKNVTKPAHQETVIENKTTNCSPKNAPDFGQGHLAWFLILAFTFVLLLAWFFIQIIGLSVSSIRNQYLK